MPESNGALFIAYSCPPFVRRRSLGKAKKRDKNLVIRIRIKAWIQDPKSRIKMRKLKRDGAPVIFFLLSFALNKGGYRSNMLK